MIEHHSFQADVESLFLGTPYVPLAPLGRGNMAEVWAVQHSFVGKTFALKVLHRRHIHNHQLIERLRREAQAMAAIDHPNVVAVTDFWTAPDGRPCLVMELLTGIRLDRLLLRQHRLPGPDVVEIAEQTLAALVAAHSMGLVHRDIRPENIFLHEDAAGSRTVKLFDFGLSRLQSGQAIGAALTPAELTRTGVVVGSPRFTAPEALSGERVQAVGDVYSLGVVLYLCLVGMYSRFDSATSPVFHSPSRCGAINCSSKLDDIILRAVETDPRLRYPSAQAFLAALTTLAALQ